MLSAGLLISAALVIIAISHWIYKWKNPACNGKLPPGSMGLPLIGETIQFLTPSNSLEIPPFIKTRNKKYGSVFKTSLAGRPVVVSSDPDFNYFILQQEGNLVELWYLDSFANLLGQTDSPNAMGRTHKYFRNLTLNHFGHESLKSKLLSKLEDMANKTLHCWKNQECVEVKREWAKVIFDFTSEELFGYDAKKSEENLGELFTTLLQGLMTFPLNIPGTTYHRCMQNQKKLFKILKATVEERRAFPEKRRGDFLDHVMDDMEKETFLTDDLIIYMIFGILIAGFEAISSTLTLALMLLTGNPLAVQELMKENEQILQNRGDLKNGLTWKEYKSMTFTSQVVNESLRLASISPGIIRRAIKDIQVHGYTIPKGWTILVVTSALQLNPDTYKDPLAFNPWRWKDLGPEVTAKNFISFGGGMRSCAGAEFSRVLMAIFLHTMVIKYRWIKVEGGNISRSPALGFGSGYYIKVFEKLK